MEFANRDLYHSKMDLKSKIPLAIRILESHLNPQDKHTLCYILEQYGNLWVAGGTLPVLQTGNQALDDLAISLIAVLGSQDDSRLSNLLLEADNLGLEMDDSLYNSLMAQGLITNPEVDNDPETQARLAALGVTRNQMPPLPRNRVKVTSNMKRVEVPHRGQFKGYQCDPNMDVDGCAPRGR